MAKKKKEDNLTDEILIPILQGVFDHRSIFINFVGLLLLGSSFLTFHEEISDSIGSQKNNVIMLYWLSILFLGLSKYSVMHDFRIWFLEKKYNEDTGHSDTISSILTLIAIISYLLGTLIGMYKLFGCGLVFIVSIAMSIVVMVIGISFEFQYSKYQRKFSKGNKKHQNNQT